MSELKIFKKAKTETRKRTEMEEKEALSNDLLQLTLTRRSIRRYTKEPIDDKIIDEIMKVALTAPSSFGHRPVEFVVVRDKSVIRELASCKSYGGSQILQADVVIVVMVNMENGEFWIEDGAIASSYILLAAEQYGLGACWVQIRNRDGKRKTSDEEIREVLGIPNNYSVLNWVSLGNKAQTKSAYSLSDYDFSKIHYEHY